jgi:hypothetical protein
VEGFVNEQTELARSSMPAPVMNVANWRVIVAAHDTLHYPKDVVKYWKIVLPEARFRTVSDAGRLLALSHPHYVVEELRGP